MLKIQITVLSLKVINSTDNIRFFFLTTVQISLTLQLYHWNLIECPQEPEHNITVYRDVTMPFAYLIATSVIIWHEVFQQN